MKLKWNFLEMVIFGLDYNDDVVDRCLEGWECFVVSKNVLFFLLCCYILLL